MGNVVALLYLVKTGGSHNKVLSDINKEIWHYLLGKEIIITAEYLPDTLNKEIDFQSQAVREPSEWKLDPKVFQTLYRK